MNPQKNGNWLHEKLQVFMGPALVTLIGSSIFRGLLGLLIMVMAGTFGTYNHWSPLIRLPIEIVVFIGVFISADVCFANTVGNVEHWKKARNLIINEDQPRFKGDAKQIAEHVTAYEKNKVQRLAISKEELQTERKARQVFGGVILLYSLNFVIQTVVTFNDLATMIATAIIEISSVAIGLYVIWYYSARFRAEKADPQETATALVETGMEKRLIKATERFKEGEPTTEDLNLADVALPNKHHYRRFVAALRKLPEGDEIMTTADIFSALGINDRTVERAIRRTIKAAFDAHKPGVFQIQNGSKTEWRMDGKAFYTLFKKFLPGSQAADRQRTTSARQRASRADGTGQSPDDGSTAAGESSRPDQPQTPSAEAIEPAPAFS